jgi:glucose/mannose-6-phosphate isomerase
VADDLILDDPDALDAADPGGALRATATSGAQIRTALSTLDHSELDRIAAEGRPRSLVITGMGGSGISADVCAAVAGTGAPIPVVPVRGYVLPGWVGPMDVVVGVSCSGSTEETVAVVDEAGRRGARLVGIASAGSPLEERVRSYGDSMFFAVDAQGRMPRLSLWTLATPVLMIASALGIADVTPSGLNATADALDEWALAYGPNVALVDNPAKDLGLEFAADLPMVWGTGEIGAAAAYRAVCQLAENAKLLAVHGVIPEANHNQVVAFDGPLAGSEDLGDIFRDRVEEPDAQRRLRLVLMRDSEEHPQVARRADASRALAESRGIPVTVINASGEAPLLRVASLLAIGDFASVYAALSLGVDPTPIGPINELKDRIA